MVEPSEAIERLMRVEAGVPARGVYPDAVRPWDYYRRDCYFAADYLLHVRPNRPRPTPVYADGDATSGWALLAGEPRAVTRELGSWCVVEVWTAPCSPPRLLKSNVYTHVYATESDALLALWHDRWEALVKIAGECQAAQEGNE